MVGDQSSARSRTPPISSNSAHQRDRADEGERHHRAGHADGAPAGPGTRSAPPVDRAGDDAGDQAAERPEREQAAGVAPCRPARRRTRPWSPRRRRTGRPARAHTSASGRTVRHGIGGRAPVAWSCGCAGGSVRALGGEGEGADARRATTAAASPATGCDGRGQHRHQDRAEDEHGLVDHGLERERGLQVGRARQHVRPAGPHAGADRREGRARDGRGDVGDRRSASRPAPTR